MQFTYNFKKKEEQFSKKVFDLLVENFSKSFFTGGTVRDMFLNIKLLDFDIATSATPNQVINLLSKNEIHFDDLNKNFGAIKAYDNNSSVDITTFRKDTYDGSRFPKTEWTKNIYLDSLRRDFTMNSLYFNPYLGNIIDYHNGLEHIQNKRIVFIGDAQQRISEDPLRIIRAYRFSITLNFSIDDETESILQSNLHLTETISKNRIQHELSKITDSNMQKELLKVMHKNT